jgi:hypothetical protein
MIEQPNPLLVASFPLILSPKIDFLLSSRASHSSDKDDTTHIVMSPLEFMQRLGALVPIGLRN